MKSGQPAELIWSALKSNATKERRLLTEKQALARVKAIAASEGAGRLPDAALQFYAAEYISMLRK